MKKLMLKFRILIISLLLSVPLFSQNITRNIVLVEDFTATWCGYCPIAARACDDLAANGDPVGIIAYHGTDDYANDDSNYRIDDYYGVTGFPTVYIDGVIETGVSGDDMYNLYKSYVDSRMAITTPIGIELTNINYTGNTFTADVVCEAVGTVTQSDLVLHASISESHIPEEWMDDSQELNFVERKMFPDAQGTSIDLINNTQVTIPISFTLDDAWIPEFCEIVVFVQDVSSKEIFNAAKTQVAELTELPDAIITVYDADGSPLQGANVTFEDLQATTNASGQVIFLDLEPGPYLYNASKDGYLPINPAYTVMQVENKQILITLTEAILLVNEDFSGSTFPPVGWTIEGGHEENWRHDYTNYAGGSIGELDFFSNPQFIGYSDFVSPFFDVSGYTNFSLMFRNHISVMDGVDEMAFSVLATSDDENWETLYYMTDVTTWIPAEQLTISLTEDYTTAGQIKLKFRVEIFSEFIFYWDIDDIWILGEEAAPVEIEKTINDITVYPNPASDFINITNAENSTIYIYDILGKLQITQQISCNNSTINIKNFQQGTYILKIKEEGETTVHKISIK